jgi:hypothetical protein
LDDYEIQDCGDDPTLGERLSLSLIPVGCAIMDFLRAIRRRVSEATAVLYILLAMVAVAREAKFYDERWWQSGGRGQIAFLVLTALTALGGFFVAIALRRALIRENRESQFQTAAEQLARLVRDEINLAPHEFGVNIWLVKGMKGFKRLVREAKVAEPRSPTPITWTKGKGIIGEAWASGKTRVWDLDHIRASNPTREAWCGLRRHERWRLSWNEFEKTNRYRAVLAVPLYRHRFGLHRVRGVAAVDALIPGKKDALKALEPTREFDAVIATCQAAFAGQPKKS